MGPRRYHRAVPRSPAGLRRLAARSANYVERKARTAHRRLGAGTGVAVDPAAERAEVLFYFPDTVDRLYQLGQWLPVLEAVAATRPTAGVVRAFDVHAALRPATSLPLALLGRYEDLMAFYERGRAKVIVYVNHAQLNFQSLTLRTALHVHVNHGESDKRSNFSNQAKAYDRVFVAGELAARRYLDNVLEFEERRLVPVGRPTLDVLPPPVVPAAGPTVLYAPTWEGESRDNDWSSLRTLGVPIIEQLLGADVRVLYKPHPRVAVSPDPRVAGAHRSILRMLASAPPERGHAALLDGDVLATFGVVDALVTDISAVGPDYLFVRPERPIVLTDVRSDPEALLRATPLSAGADVVDRGTVAGLGRLVTSRLATDARRSDRLAVRRAYFGDLAPDGESTSRFLTEIEGLCRRRDELLAATVQA
jgi:hypothetical protein